MALNYGKSGDSLNGARRSCKIFLRSAAKGGKTKTVLQSLTDLVLVSLGKCTPGRAVVSTSG